MQLSQMGEDAALPDAKKRGTPWDRVPVFGRCLFVAYFDTEQDHRRFAQPDNCM